MEDMGDEEQQTSEREIEWVKIAPTESITAAAPLVIEHSARRVAIFREGEEFFAIEDICPHMGAFISNGHREGRRAVCPWHNWEFDLANGECCSNDTGARVETYPLQVVDGYLWLPRRLSEEYEEEFEE
jgi:nitrite reductase (NADH) small subunit